MRAFTQQSAERPMAVTMVRPRRRAIGPGRRDDVLDRFIQQAVMQVPQADWDRTFSEMSFGFRPGARRIRQWNRRRRISRPATALSWTPT
jgi:hypothetical protein